MPRIDQETAQEALAALVMFADACDGLDPLLKDALGKHWQSIGAAREASGRVLAREGLAMSLAQVPTNTGRRARLMSPEALAALYDPQNPLDPKFTDAVLSAEMAFRSLPYDSLDLNYDRVRGYSITLRHYGCIGGKAEYSTVTLITDGCAEILVARGMKIPDGATTGRRRA